MDGCFVSMYIALVGRKDHQPSYINEIVIKVIVIEKHDFPCCNKVGSVNLADDVTEICLVLEAIFF